MITPVVDLVFDEGCPNVAEARVLLAAALDKQGLPVEWREWMRGRAETSVRFGGFGSPTILVDGVDIERGDANESLIGVPCCRLYPHDDHMRGVPDFATIASALARAIALSAPNGRAYILEEDHPRETR
jgi:hypothetical protein